MINQALQHCVGIGPVRLRQLHKTGVQTWQDALRDPEQIPSSCRAAMIEECRRCQTALERGEVQYFVDRFAPQDKWRILSHYFSQATFFDIETLGLSSADPITMIVSWHQGNFSIFVEHENLDDFLGQLDQVDLLVSFNGSTFDVPRVLDSFHIPALPCPHLDLRWTTYHRGLSGGLKEIASAMGIERPPDLQEVSGEQAVQLWQAWRAEQEEAARQQLIRYCAADVLLTVLVAQQLVDREDSTDQGIWSTLPAAARLPVRLQQAPWPNLALPLALDAGPPTNSRARNRRASIRLKDFDF